jgi:formylglycine-generating enzyme required for sulfatase activity
MLSGMRVVLVTVRVGVLVVGVLAWTALDLPPLRLVLSHGFPPAGGPTGRMKEIEGVRFVEIGTGYFRMGSWFQCTKGDALGRICKVFHLPWGKQPVEKGDEVAVHWVEIREPYWIADCEVTNAQYERFDPKHERDWPGDHDPVTSVSWDDAEAYCDWLAKRSALPVRLPSEAEWEYACRAGSRSEYCFGDDNARLGDYAWTAENSRLEAHEVKTRRQNAWGLYDMHGNVWEWCEDTYHESYAGAPDDGRAWTGGGRIRAEGTSPYRVIRGGVSEQGAWDCRSAERDCSSAVTHWGSIGFRSACAPLDP